MAPDSTIETDDLVVGAGVLGTAFVDALVDHRFLASGRVRFFPMCDYLRPHSGLNTEA